MKDPIFELCDRAREASFSLHQYLKHGHAEKVYENGLVNRLRIIGLDVKQQHPLQVFDEDGTLLGEFYADLLIENQLIVELKACRSIVDDHMAQILGYLRASRMEHGLLINFGSPTLWVKKLVLSQHSFDETPPVLQ
jgi:GxxExxY protein